MRRLLACALVLAAAPLAAQRRATGAPTLLFPGSDPRADSALVVVQRWLGLYQTAGGGHELRAVNVRISHQDAGCSESKVVTTGSPPPLFLVSGVPNLSAGPVATIFTGHRFLYPGENESWQLADGWYNLRASGTATQVPYGTSFTDYTLQLGTSRDNYTLLQTFGPMSFGDTHPTIRWIGDLDRDGRFDILWEVPIGGYSEEIQLWLSSAAGANAHVGIVGRYANIDC